MHYKFISFKVIVEKRKEAKTIFDRQLIHLHKIFNLIRLVFTNAHLIVIFLCKLKMVKLSDVYHYQYFQFVF